MMLNQFFFQSLTSVSSVEGFWCKVSFRFKCSTSPQTLANSTHPISFLTCDNVSIRFEFVTRSCCVFCVLNLSYFNAWAGILLLLKEIMSSICERQYDWGGYSQVSPTPPENWPNKISRTFFQHQVLWNKQGDGLHHETWQGSRCSSWWEGLPPRRFPCPWKAGKVHGGCKVSSKWSLWLFALPVFVILWLIPFLRYGIYPLTAFAMAVPPPSKAEPSTPELHRYFVAQVLKREMWLTDHYLVRTCRSDSEKANEPEPQDEESRRVNTMQVCFSNSNQKSG